MYIKLFEDFINEALVAESKISDLEVEKKLEDTSKNSGIPIGILRTLMRRGMEKYQSSSPHSNKWNATEKEYGYARVDSFIKKDKSTWGSADSDLAKTLNEALTSKKPNEVETVEVDMTWDDSDKEENDAAKDAFKKYNLKVKKIKGGQGTEHEVTGKKKDIIAYLQSKFYEMDPNDIKEFYPELLEGNSEETAEIQLNEDVYPRSKGGDIEASLRSEEIGRLNLKHKGDIIGTLLVWMRPEFVSYNNYDDSKWEVGASYTAYPVSSSGHSTGTGIWGAGKSFSKDEAIKVGKEFIKNIKLS